MEKDMPFCPNCNSDDTDMYPIENNDIRKRYFCRQCGFVWEEKEKEKQIEYKAHFDISKIKNERQTFNYLGKITDSDISEVLLDLYVFGGNKFYKKK